MSEIENPIPGTDIIKGIDIGHELAVDEARNRNIPETVFGFWRTGSIYSVTATVSFFNSHNFRRQHVRGSKSQVLSDTITDGSFLIISSLSVSFEIKCPL